MQSTITPWARFLDGSLPQPADWQFAFAIHGLPAPVPQADYAEFFPAFEVVYGIEALISGLRRALTIPPSHGSGVDVRQLQTLKAAYTRAQAATR